jgi:hypothetical protein
MYEPPSLTAETKQSAAIADPFGSKKERKIVIDH